MLKISSLLPLVHMHYNNPFFALSSIGDPCQFFSGKEYHLLLKVVLIFEACSGKWDQSVMDEDIKNLDIGEKDLMTFLKSCMGSDETILKIHYPIPNDPTIGKNVN